MDLSTIYSLGVLIILLNVFRSRLHLPKLLFRVFMHLYGWYKNFQSEPLQLNLEMFERGQFGLKNSKKLKGQTSAKVQLLYISTKKDFNTLPTSIEYAINSLKSFRLEQISIYVPENQVSECSELSLSSFPQIDIKSESDLVSRQQWELLRKSFGTRAGWVLQQILKVAGTLHSNMDFTLIVDSDTIILRERNWIPRGKSGVLTPSDEFTPDYYLFLQKLGVGSERPKHSFVSHHMLIEKKFLVEALSHIGARSISDLVEICVDRADKNSFSPLCVDYELYAQFMMEHHPEKVQLEKWANLGIPAKYFEFFNTRKYPSKVLSGLYDSISFHSWS